MTLADRARGLWHLHERLTTPHHATDDADPWRAGLRQQSYEDGLAYARNLELELRECADFLASVLGPPK